MTRPWRWTFAAGFFIAYVLVSAAVAYVIGTRRVADVAATALRQNHQVTAFDVTMQYGGLPSWGHLGVWDEDARGLLEQHYLAAPVEKGGAFVVCADDGTPAGCNVVDRPVAPKETGESLSYWLPLSRQSAPAAAFDAGLGAEICGVASSKPGCTPAGTIEAVHCPDPLGQNCIVEMRFADAQHAAASLAGLAGQSKVEVLFVPAPSQHPPVKTRRR